MASVKLMASQARTIFQYKNTRMKVHWVNNEIRLNSLYEWFSGDNAISFSKP